jgi:hypothetical protein
MVLRPVATSADPQGIEAWLDVDVDVDVDVDGLDCFVPDEHPANATVATSITVQCRRLMVAAYDVLFTGDKCLDNHEGRRVASSHRC